MPKLMKIAAVVMLGFASEAAAGPLDGKTFLLQMSSSQYNSGYSEYLVPPLVKALKQSGMHSTKNTHADLIANVLTGSDQGKWLGKGQSRAWTYEVKVTVGLSPESYSFPPDETPAFGVEARLLTPDSDREDELACLIGLAARTAVANIRSGGILRVDGVSCLRK